MPVCPVRESKDLEKPSRLTRSRGKAKREGNGPVIGAHTMTHRAHGTMSKKQSQFQGPNQPLNSRDQ